VTFRSIWHSTHESIHSRSWPCRHRRHRRRFVFRVSVGSRRFIEVLHIATSTSIDRDRDRVSVQEIRSEGNHAFSLRQSRTMTYFVGFDSEATRQAGLIIYPFNLSV